MPLSFAFLVSGRRVENAAEDQETAGLIFF